MQSIRRVKGTNPKNKEQKQKFRIVKRPYHTFKTKTESLVYGTVNPSMRNFLVSKRGATATIFAVIYSLAKFRIIKLA